MSAYIVFNYKINDPEALRPYAAAGKVLGEFEHEILVNDTSCEVLEGEPFPKTVVIKFPSKEVALAWYHSSGYQAVIHHRRDNSVGVAVLCDGFEGPQFRAQ